MEADPLAHRWWLYLLRAGPALAFAAAALPWPEPGFLSLGFSFGVFALLDGATLTATAALAARGGARSLWMLIGAALASAGAVSLASAGAASGTLLDVVAAWAIASAGSAIGAALLRRRRARPVAPLLWSGALSLALGVGLLVSPGVKALGQVWLLCACAAALGGLRIAFAIRLRAQGGAPRAGARAGGASKEEAAESGHPRTP